jgi:F-type H+-transporting ATPase subunit a
MNATTRGAIIFGVLVVVLVLCSAISFGVLPGMGSAATLPVIVVPGEPYLEGWPSEGFYWTNTLTAMILADILVLIFILLVWRSSKGWTSKVPGRFQSWAEMLGGFIYAQVKNFAGTRPLARNWLFPLAASIFVFLLAVNWMKLLPGIESVGVMHCAGHSAPEIGITVSAGHPKLGDRLWVPEPLRAGIPADEEDYHACEEYKEGIIPKPDKAALDSAATELEAEELALVAELQEQGIEQDEIDSRVQELRLEATEAVWEHASIGLTAREMREGVIPYLFVVTPYVRGGSTDLNMTLGLALVAFFAIQIFGVAAQGPNYFQKFINLDALGKLQKKPLGAVDFIVGIFEIISEIGKIISLSFRLFGNMFAGGILLAVMSFLVALFVPMIFYGLEIIITTIQALVFAVLTIVFSAQAMEGHHGEDEHHGEPHDGHHDDGHAAEDQPSEADLTLNRTAV